MSWVKKSFVLAADLSLLISQFSLPASAANPENLVKPEFTESADGNPTLSANLGNGEVCGGI